jgi:2-dehydropantoate 2-reductase
MKFAVFGIGGIGGLFGGMLAKAGYDTTFIARGETLATLQQKGLRVESIMGNFTLPHVQATGNPAEVGPVDVIFVATKTWQVPEAARQIPPMLGGNTVVVPLQNGVEAFEQLAEALGAEHVLGGLCHVITFVSAPGVIKHISMKPSITLGEWNNSRSTRVENLAQCLQNAGFEVRLPENIQVALWEKFLYIASLGGVGAVSRCPVGTMRTLPETRALLDRAAREIVVLARAHGIPVAETAIDQVWKLLESLPPEGTSSMQRDVMNGRPSELSSLSGAVARLAKAKGVSSPAHEFMYSALLPGELRARGEIKF